MNKVILNGRLTKDVTLRKTTAGTSVAEFTLAVQRKVANADGKKDADFIDCVAWRTTAELLEKYCHKGGRIGLVGSIQKRSYDNKEGNKVWVTEVIVDEIEFLETKKQEEAPAPEEAPEEIPDIDYSISDDDLPF